VKCASSVKQADSRIEDLPRFRHGQGHQCAEESSSRSASDAPVTTISAAMRFRVQRSVPKPAAAAVWGGAAGWLFGQGEQGWGVFLVAWGLAVTVMDNVVKPWLIGFGVTMPLSLTILGVFGGFVSFGFLGLFIGPTLIAVAFTLLGAWRGAPAAAPGAAVR
jgi:hypothetical protein